MEPSLCTIENHIAAILFSLDPIRLRVMGAPKDEYSPEARDIASQLTHCITRNDVEDLITRVFCESFTEKLTTSASEKILEASKQIWATVVPIVKAK